MRGKITPPAISRFFFALLKSQEKEKKKISSRYDTSLQAAAKSTGRGDRPCSASLPYRPRSLAECLVQMMLVCPRREIMFLFPRIRKNCHFLWCPRKLQLPGLFTARGRHSCVSLGTSGLKFVSLSLCWHLVGIQGPTEQVS